MNKLGIIGAMTVEVQTLKEQMQGVCVHKRAGMEFYDGALDGMPAVVVQCGVGKVNAAMCVQILCDCFDNKDCCDSKNCTDCEHNSCILNEYREETVCNHPSRHDR